MNSCPEPTTYATLHTLGYPPWYVTWEAKCLAGLLLLGPCWLSKMQQYMGLQYCVFHKRCSGWKL